MRNRAQKQIKVVNCFVLASLALAVEGISADGPAKSSSSVVVFPAPAEIKVLDGTAPIGAGARIIVPAGEEKALYAADMLAAELGKALGAEGGKLAVVSEEQAGEPKAGDIALGTAAKGKRAAGCVGGLAAELSKKEGAYVLAVRPKGIGILGRDADGAFYGALTLLQLFTPGKAGSGAIACAEISDFPYQFYRGIRSALPRGKPMPGELTHEYTRTSCAWSDSAG